MKWYYVLILLIVNSCQQPQGKNQKLSNGVGSLIVDTTGFLFNCSKWSGGISQGYLQGLEIERDSLGPFCFYECYSCSRTFELVFVYKDFKKSNNSDLIWDDFESGCDNMYTKFECFCFIYKFRNPDTQKDVHALNMDFPLRIKAYKRIIDDKWIFVKEITAKTFEDFSLFRFKTIYLDNVFSVRFLCYYVNNNKLIGRI